LCREEIDVRLGNAVNTVTPDDECVKVQCADGDELEADILLWAAGRSSNTQNLGLEEVGVELGNRGLVIVDDNYQTNVPGIYAGGDVIGFPALASTSMEQGRIAACHMFGFDFKQSLSKTMPIGLYTIPAVSKSFDVKPHMLHAMLEGQIDDLAGRQYETFEQLREYCYRVASSVGLLCINIWGYNDSNAPELAIDRGIAFQLTNILRDYKEDYDVGRIYLPAEDFTALELTPQQLRNWSEPDKCRQFINAQAKRAMSFYDRSKPLDQMITPSCRPALWAMTTIYRSLLRKIQHQPAQIIENKRVRLGAWHKGMIAFRAKFGGVTTRNGSH